MAPRAASPSRKGSPWRRLRGLPLLAALSAGFHEAGINGVAAATIATLAVPVTAAVFVYEVQALRGAQLAREASDRARRDVTVAVRPLPGRESTGTSPAPQNDVAAKLDTMLAHRSALLDTFGDEAAAVAPVYSRIIKQMLKDDDATFALLKAKRAESSGPSPAAVREKEESLHTVHERLARLVEP